MPFAFSQIDPRTQGEISNPVIPLNRYLGAVWNEGIDSSVFQSVSKLEELRLAHDGPMIAPEEANTKYGLPGLTFDSPVYEEVARLKRDRRRAELDRQYYLQHGSDGLFSGRGAAQLGVGFLASISNPLDAALMFMPVVGSEARAAKLAEMGIGTTRQALARGVISTEMLAKTFPRMHGFVESGVSAMTQQALMEVPVAFAKLTGGQEYTPQTFLQDVVGAGALSTVLHAGFRALGRMHDATKAAVLKKAMSDFVEGKDIDVKGLVNIDENIIRQRAMFDETAARERASLNINEDAIKKAVFDKYGENVKTAALRVTHPDGSVEVLTGDAHALIFGQHDVPSDAQLEAGFVTDKGRFIDRGEAAALTNHPGNMLTAEEMHTANDHVEAIMEDGYSREEAKKIAKEDRAREIQNSFLSRPDIQEKLAQERETAIKDYVEKLKQEHDPEAAFKRQLEEEVASQLRDGKVLSEEHAKKYGFETAEKAVPAITEDVNEMMKSLQDELKQLDEDVKNLKSPNAEILLKALDKVKMQINPGDLHAFGLIPEAWNFFVETLKALVKAGDAVAQTAKSSVLSKEKKSGMNRRRFLDIIGKGIAATQAPLPALSSVAGAVKPIKELFSLSSFSSAMQKIHKYRENLLDLKTSNEDPIVQSLTKHFLKTSENALVDASSLVMKLSDVTQFDAEFDVRDPFATESIGTKAKSKMSQLDWADSGQARIEAAAEMLAVAGDAHYEDLKMFAGNDPKFEKIAGEMVTMTDRLKKFFDYAASIDTITKAPELNKAQAKERITQEEAQRNDAISQALAATKEKYPDLTPNEQRIREVIGGDVTRPGDEVTKEQLKQVKELRSIDDAITAAVNCMRNKII